MPGYTYAPDREPDDTEIEAITRISRGYWQGWYAGDAEHMGRCLHADFELLGLVHQVLDEGTDFVTTDAETRSSVLQHCAMGTGVADPEERTIEVTVLAATHHVASVRAVGHDQTHLLHLMRFPEGWQIVRAIFTQHAGAIPNQSYDM